MATDYSPTFYDTIRDGCRKSAAAVVPLVIDVIHPTTAVDVGCGEGWWAHEFAEYGCDVLGIDGSYVDSSPLGDRFLAADLAQPLPLQQLGQFDLAISLEVAEHLPPARAAGFVADLCALAPVILFSAAIPFQSGAGHVNCQWTSYWAELFAAHGFTTSTSIRSDIWDDERIEPWYRQNLLIAGRTICPSTFPLDVVHPVIHRWGR